MVLKQVGALANDTASAVQSSAHSPNSQFPISRQIVSFHTATAYAKSRDVTRPDPCVDNAYDKIMQARIQG
jgi:hypothetical protein